MAAPADPRDDLLRLTPYLPSFAEVALLCRRDTALLAAICLRETWAGWAPGYTPLGDYNGRGDLGHGRGLFQIDDRGPFRHLIPPAGQDWPPEVQALAACEVLEDAEEKLRAHFPSLSVDQLEEAMLCAYNAGVDAVSRALQQGISPNLCTTGRDYGRDVRWRLDDLRRRYPETFPPYLLASQPLA